MNWVVIRAFGAKNAANYTEFRGGCDENGPVGQKNNKKIVLGVYYTLYYTPS